MTSRMRRSVCGLLVIGLLVGLSSTGWAQTADSYRLQYYNAGAPSPFQTDPFPATDVVCNQAPPPSFSTVNPNRVWWDDPSLPGRSCLWIPSPTANLFSVPVPGSYEGTLTAINVGGSSPESARVPFSRAAALPAPTGLSLGRLP